jgi:hypothetical protein
MKPGLPLKRIFYVFLISLAAYFAIFFLIEHGRTRKGPWRIAFASAGEGSHPFLIINEPRLNIADLKITFPRQSAPATNAVLIFNEPREVPFEVPFGQCIFLDLLSRPGTVTLKLFDHEIQLLPRVLTIDGREHAWQSATNIEVVP